MAYSLYLIRNTRDTDLYYAEHGEIGGVPDAVGYDEPLHAMKFRTYEEAQAYIDTSSRRVNSLSHSTELSSLISAVKQNFRVG